MALIMTSMMALIAMMAGTIYMSVKLKQALHTQTAKVPMALRSASLTRQQDQMASKMIRQLARESGR